MYERYIDVRIDHLVRTLPGIPWKSGYLILTSDFVQAPVILFFPLDFPKSSKIKYSSLYTAGILFARKYMITVSIRILFAYFFTGIVLLKGRIVGYCGLDFSVVTP